MQPGTEAKTGASSMSISGALPPDRLLTFVKTDSAPAICQVTKHCWLLLYAVFVLIAVLLFRREPGVKENSKQCCEQPAPWTNSEQGVDNRWRKHRGDKTRRSGPRQLTEYNA